MKDRLGIEALRMVVIIAEAGGAKRLAELDGPGQIEALKAAIERIERVERRIAAMVR